MTRENKYDPRSDSIAWELIVDKKGNPILDYNNNPLYQSIRVVSKGEKVIFCPYCNQYKDLITFDVGYGLKEKGCESCGITTRDFHMKRVNDL